MPADSARARRRADRRARRGRARRGARRAGAQVEALCAALAPLIRVRYPDGGRARAAISTSSCRRGARRAGPAPLRRRAGARSARLAAPTSPGRPHLDEDYLVLSTVHSAKGLEWDAVHLIARLRRQLPGRHERRQRRRASPRSVGCSTSRSRARGVGCTCTCPCATTTARAAATTRTATARPRASSPLRCRGL